MATVRLQKIVKRYRSGTTVIKELSLEIADGEFVSIVGPSGCGKSTTLNLIAGLDEPTSGRIFIGDTDVTTKDPGARDIAMVFQSYALYPHMTVAQNIGFPLKVARQSEQEIGKRVAQTAELLGLTELLKRTPRELSGGQRQRVALGRALVRRPKAFLFDEPLSNLDAGLRAQMRGELKRLHEQLKATFIYVTHDQAEAMTLSHRIVLMREGEIEQLAPPRELYDHPRTRFAAEFFGQPKINIFEGAALGFGPGTKGLRPEHVSVTTEPSEGGFGGTVELVEPLGAETWITVLTQGLRLTGRSTGATEPKMGEQARVTFDRARVVNLSPAHELEAAPL